MVKRELYIDVLKGIAMLAVIVDHTRSYNSVISALWPYSILSVSVFTIVLGYNLWFSYERKPDASLKALWGKMSKFLLYYCIVTLVLMLANVHKFDLLLYLHNIVYFQGNAAFYFCFLYIQFILISGLVYRLVSSSNKLSYDIAILISAYILSVIFENYTAMLPLHGGGVFLFGGSYFFLFVLGYILAKRYDSFKSSSIYVQAGGFVFCMLLWCFSLNFIDKAWSNPPNPYAMLYAISSFFVIVSANVILVERIPQYIASASLSATVIQIFSSIKKVCSLPILAVAFVGKYSLHVFLWQAVTVTTFNGLSHEKGFSSIALILTVISALLFGIISEYVVKYFKKHLL